MLEGWLGSGFNYYQKKCLIQIMHYLHLQAQEILISLHRNHMLMNNMKNSLNSLGEWWVKLSMMAIYLMHILPLPSINIYYLYQSVTKICKNKISSFSRVWNGYWITPPLNNICNCISHTNSIILDKCRLDNCVKMVIQSWSQKRIKYNM